MNNLETILLINKLLSKVTITKIKSRFIMINN